MLSASTEETTIQFRRKGRKTLKDNYFDVREEMAVRMFLTATTFNERNKIYNEFLRDPLDKMISSIIRRYKLYRKDMNFDEIHIDTHSFLMTKIEKFSPSQNTTTLSKFSSSIKRRVVFRKCQIPPTCLPS